jgi:phosphoserine phosphatase
MKSDQEIVPGNGWSPDVRSAIARVMRDTPRSERRVAVFDFDNTCILGDIGELFSHFLIDELLYRFDLDAFWDLIDEEDGRDNIRELALASIDLPGASRDASDVYRNYLAEMGALYGRKLVREGKAATYAWAVLLHLGISELDMKVMSQRAIDIELARPVHVETRDTSRGNNVFINRGIRPFQEIALAMRALERAGFETWVVSATNQWSVETFAAHFGIPDDRVVGNRVFVEYGVLTDELVPPALYRDGKVEAVAREIGATPTIVFGDSDTDFDMMATASRLGVVIDHGNEEMRAGADAHGWVVQPQVSLTTLDSLREIPR